MSRRPGRSLVMGLGSFGGGGGAARYLAEQGWRVLATDLRPASQLEETLAELADLDLELVLGEHRPADFDAVELVVVNPAVRPDHPLVERARAAGARIASAVELFLETVHARLFCVTGTQGKSSTAHLLAGLLEACGHRVHLGGNIGGSLLSGLDSIGPQDCCVLELSSYQLEGLAHPRALAEHVRHVEAVCITNVLADHLERHGSPERYAAAKRRILDLVGPAGWALVPAGDARVRAWETRAKRLPFQVEASHAETGGPEAGLFVREDEFRLDELVLGQVADLRLPGAFQRANALCALGLAHLAGVPAGDLAAALPHIGGLPHRLEELGRFAGRRVIDNGVSTTPDSTVSALREVEPGTCVLLGGRHKRLPLEELVAMARAREVVAITFGEARDELAAALRAGGCRVESCDTLEQAVTLAFERTERGGSILFSPACSSFDAYPNFRRRAEAFRALLPDRAP